MTGVFPIGQINLGIVCVRLFRAVLTGIACGLERSKENSIDPSFVTHVDDGQIE